jgi:phosphate transport system permease protein
MSQTLNTKTPQKPWKLTPKQLLPDLLGAIFTVVATFAIVALSPLKGKLGFALVLIFMAIITATTISWITRDRKAATNATKLL